MPKRLSIQPHLTLDALEQRYRSAKDPIVRSHWQMVWLLAQGRPSERVAAVPGYTANWVRTIAQRYNQHGPAALGDRRHRNPGAAGLVLPAQHEELARALGQPPPDGGRWTGPKVSAWTAAILGRPVHPQRGWEMLQRLGWPSKVPRPRHAQADPQAQAAFKKAFQPQSAPCSRRTPRNG
jgi:transposase